MKTKILALGLGALIAFTSCIKDEGGYELKNLNNAAITSFVKGNATIGDPYIIKPVIDYKDASENDFEYFWFANLSDYTTHDTLSHEKDLSYVFTKAGFYIGVFQVKNKKTGGITSKVFTFNVSSRYQTGWLILSEKNGNSILSYSRVSSGVIDNTFIDIYGSIYGPDKLGSGPLSLGRHYSDQADEILVVSDGCSVELDGTNFKKVITTDKEFVGDAYPSGFAPLKAEYGSKIEIVVGKDGSTYTRKRNSNIFQSVRYSTVPIDNAKVTLTHFAPSMQYILFNDDLNHRIMGIQDFPPMSVGKILYAKLDPLGGNSPDFTDLSNMGTDSKVIYLGSYASSMDRAYVQIVKKGDKYRIQKFQLRLESPVSSLFVINGTESDFIGNGIVSDNTKYFATNSQYLFFGEGNSLYYYDFNLNKITVYSTFAGKVTAIESNSNKDQIAVGLDNGEFYVFNISNEVLASGAPSLVTKVENLGKVVALQYKYGNVDNFNIQK